ncbi:MAG TPA: lamin tail domain-containing protein, partial [Chloroflexota bacterium]|nr:lamin tail domain-containing protein [Chloroflexota bacterium]
MFRRLFWLTTAVFLPLLGLVVMVSARSVTAGGTTVLIDAVLYDGYESGDADEAVRIRNVSDQVVDISGWQLNDGESSTAVIPLTTTLNPGQAIWLAKNGTAFQRQFGFPPDFERNDTLPGVPNLGGAWPSLANTGDQVMLRDGANALIDCLAYESNPNEQCGSAWVGPALQPYAPNTSFSSN